MGGYRVCVYPPSDRVDAEVAMTDSHTPEMNAMIGPCLSCGNPTAKNHYCILCGVPKPQVELESALQAAEARGRVQGLRTAVNLIEGAGSRAQAIALISKTIEQDAGKGC